jgi:hypothetical protein
MEWAEDLLNTVPGRRAICRRRRPERCSAEAAITGSGTCTMMREVGVHLWRMIWCIRSTKECVTTDVSQFVISPFTFLGFQGLYDIVSSHLGYGKVCARWLPKMITEHKKHHVSCALTFFMHYHKEGDGVSTKNRKS